MLPGARSTRFRHLAATALGGVLVLSGCQPEGSGTPSGSPPPSAVVIPSVSASEEALALPPTAEAELAAIFDPLIEEYGLRLSRAALLELGEPYEESESGRFLGLYVEPTGEYTPEEYLENLVPVARIMLTLSFERWPGLEVADVCQEPPPDVDDSETPTPETQVQVSREASAALDWEALALPELIAVARNDEPPGVVLRISSRLAEEPLWQDAVEASEGD